MHDDPTRDRFDAARPGYLIRSRIPIAVCSVMVATAIASASVNAPIDAILRHDASLADVFFVNEKLGWAVGDRGVIWYTTDGGINWSLQTSNVDCRLNAVCFIDRHHGWIVGGEHRPFAHSTRGVILRTEDGGNSWAAVPGLSLPLLTRVKFFDENVGVALGYGSSSLPSGVFLTRDGGQSWQPLPSDQTGAWLTGDFFEANTGAVAGPGGSYATIARNQILNSPLATQSLRSFHAMRLIAPAGGWIVGDGGMVMSTSDGGRSWQSPPAELPNGVAENFDFHALAVRGQKIWIAGTPGTRIFRSHDDGQSWQAFDTGHNAPIRSLTFIDAQHGWAVGDLGCILATHDGGSTWRVQQGGGRRAAILAVFANAMDVPLELIAQIGAAEGYIAAVNVVHAEGAISANDEVTTKSAATQALVRAGAAAADFAWQFPLPAENLALTPEDRLVALNRATDGRALELLERHLVRQLRMWRPNIVVTRHDADSSPSLIEHALLRAVAAAADPAQFIELTSGVGLEPWQVNKVFGVLPAGFHGDERIETGRFSSALRATPADFAALSRRLLCPRYAFAQDVIELKSLMTFVADIGGQPGVFSGIPLGYGSDARRAAPELVEDDAEALRQLATRRRHLQQLLERTEGNAAWAGQVANITKGLDPTGGGDLLLQLAEGYRANGNLDLAADTYYLFTRQYPQHPLVDSALVWIVQFYASGEAAHRATANSPVKVGTSISPANGAIHSDELQRNTPSNDSSAPDENVLQAGAESIVPNGTPAAGLSPDDRRRRAVQLTEYFRTARPHLYAEPLVRFAEVTAQRQLGYSNEAKRYFLSLRQLPENNSWRRCAASEDWLANPGDIPPPKPIAACRRAAARPYLDGRLGEQIWKSADVVRLRGDQMPAFVVSNDHVTKEKPEASVTNPAAPNHGQIRLAYDNEFFYLAISCPKIAGLSYNTDGRARLRDADLSQYDRVEIQLDLDRDFTTAYSLEVDSRGWSRDACWDDAHWNPTWYVSMAESETSWTIEAAVPLAELTNQPPAARHVWAASARRTIPRVGYESWSGAPTAEESPDQFGLLIFE